MLWHGERADGRLAFLYWPVLGTLIEGAKLQALLPDCQRESAAVHACRLRIVEQSQEPLSKVLIAAGVRKGHCQQEAEASRECSRTLERRMTH